jgi:hypothetical protein
MKKIHASLLFPEYDSMGPVSATDVEKIFRNTSYGPGNEADGKASYLLPVRI